METYNKKIKTNDSVELVMISGDDQPAKALNWATSEKFPWPSILDAELEKATEAGKAFMSEADASYPYYMLVDKEGKVLAKGNGKAEVFEAAGL